MVSDASVTRNSTLWASLVRELEQAYGPSICESLGNELFTLFQEGSISNYCITFIVFVNRVKGITPSALLSYFISRLKKDIMRDVIPWRPESFTTSVALAKLYEDKYDIDYKLGNKR